MCVHVSAYLFLKFYRQNLEQFSYILHEFYVTRLDWTVHSRAVNTIAACVNVAFRLPSASCRCFMPSLQWVHVTHLIITKAKNEKHTLTTCVRGRGCLVTCYVITHGPRRIALPTLDSSNKRRWVISATPRPL